jgi:hypothetical protein
MEITDRAVMRDKTATKYRFAAATTLWFLLSNSAANVCAQSIASGDRVIAPALHPVVSKSETSTARQNPPAGFIERIIGNTPTSEAESNGRIIVDSATTQGDPTFVRPVHTPQSADPSNGGLEKVTATSAEKPIGTHMSTSVTLWDEIAPPLPAPVPVDAAARAAPNEEANSGARRTQ